MLSHYKWRVYLFVAMLPDMNVQKPCDQRSLQCSSRPSQYVKSRAADLDSTFDVQDSQLGADLPVWFRLEVEYPRCSHRAQDNVRGFVRANWNSRMGQVGNPQHQFLLARI